METFSYIFENARRGTSWSLRKLQRELSDVHDIKVSYSFLGAIEKGRRVPSYDLACALAKILEIDIKEVLRATYCSRIQNDRNRESLYLENAIRKWGISDLSPYEVTSEEC